MSAEPASLDSLHATSLTRKNLTVLGDLIVDGDVNIAGNLIVAGDLIIKGVCRVKNLYCLGHATIHGNAHFGSIRILGVLECLGDAIGEEVFGVAEANAVFANIPLNSSTKAALAYSDWRQEEEHFVREKYAYAGGGGTMVTITGDLSLATLQIVGSIVVGGDCSFDAALIHGSGTILGNAIGKDLEITGSFRIEKRLTVHRKLFAASDITCNWSCAGGDIEVKGNLEARHAIIASDNLLCGGHIKSDNRIQVRGMVVAMKSIQAASSIFAAKGLQAGGDYGIFAGMSVPGSLLPVHGYIAAPSRPPGIRSGYHIENMRFKKLSPRQVVGWPADDGSDRL